MSSAAQRAEGEKVRRLTQELVKNTEQRSERINESLARIRARNAKLGRIIAAKRG